MRAIVVGLLLVGGAANAYVLRKDSSGHPVRWAGPVKFAVEADLANKLGELHAMDAVDASLETWRKVLPSEKLDRVSEQELNVGYDLSGLAQQNTILVPPEWGFSPDAIAVTVLTVDNQAHQIVDADIALNPKRLFRVLPPEGLLNTTADDIQNALTHELGHALGLAHNPDLPTAVMYPSARPGETLKRTLSADDLDGIRALYDLPAPQGCSSTEASPGWIALIAAALFLAGSLRRRSGRGLGQGAALLMGLALLPLAAHASEPQRPPAPAAQAQAVLVGRVMQVRTLPPATNGGPMLLFSEVTLQVDHCLKGTCPASVVIHVAGGHWGRFDQYVADAPLPTPGATVGLTIDPGATLTAPSIEKTRVYDLGRMRDFAAFAQGLTAAHLTLRVAPPGSK